MSLAYAWRRPPSTSLSHQISSTIGHCLDSNPSHVCALLTQQRKRSSNSLIHTPLNTQSSRDGAPSAQAEPTINTSSSMEHNHDDLCPDRV
eukprot:147272-Pelagomonas_calceolata.AAC.1